MSRTTIRFAATLIVAAGTLSAIAPKPPSASVTAPAPAPAGAGAAATLASAHLPMRFEVNAGQFGTRADFVASAGGTTLAISAGELALTLQSQPPSPSPSPVSQSKRPHRPAGPAAPGTVSTVHLKLVGAADVPGQGVGQLPGVSNYLFGNDRAKWHVGVHAYSAVRYNGVWPGIDLVVRDGAASPEYDFEVAPGADPGRIKLAVSGGLVHLDQHGDLVVNTPAGALRQAAPHLSQRVGTAENTVAGGFVMRPDGTIGFSVGTHDPKLPLIIDPELVYSTQLGGPITTDIADGQGMAVAVAGDAAGSGYVTGFTQSPLFPISAGAFQGGIVGQDIVAYVTKLSPDGKSLAYSTYLAGDAYKNSRGQLVTTLQEAGGIAVDRSGHAAIKGFTTAPNFPTTPTAFEPTPVNDFNTGCGCITYPFVTVLNAAGTDLVYSTYLGDTGLAGDLFTGQATPGAVADDANGDVYVVGTTGSALFPTTPGAFEPACPCDASFGDMQTTSGSTTFTSASAHFGSADVGIEVTGPNIPTINVPGVGVVFPFISAVLSPTQIQLKNRGALQAATGNGSGLPFTMHNRARMNYFTVASKLDPSKVGAASLVYSTYLAESPTSGGLQTLPIQGDGVAVDGTGSAYVTGRADVVGYPTTPGAYRTDCGCNGTFTDGAIAAGSTTLTSASASFAPGDAGLPIIGIGLQAQTTIASVVGPTQIQLSQPATGTAAPASFTVVNRTGIVGPFTAIAKLNSAGSGLVYSTYLGPLGVGASGGPGHTSIAIDPAGNAYVTGTTQSSLYPTTSAAFQTTVQGGQSAFVTKVNPAGSGLVYSTLLGSPFGTNYVETYHYLDFVGGIGVDEAGHAYVTGETFDPSFPSVDPFTAPSICCLGVFVSEFTPDGTQLISSTQVEAGEGTAVALGPDGSIFVAGMSFNLDQTALVTPSAADPEIPDVDSFVLRLLPTLPGTARVTAIAPVGGPRSGGTTVDITGTGFSAADGVSFGGVPASSFAVNSDTSITAVSPPQSAVVETAPVRVSTAAGSSPGNPPSYFTYGEGSWAVAASMPSPHTGVQINGITGGFPPLNSAAVLLHDGRVFIAGGVNVATSGFNVTTTVTPDAAVYDPGTGVWTAAASLDSCAPNPACSPRVGQTTTVLPNGNVLVAGGSDGNNVLGTAEIYDPTANAWTAAAPMSQPRIQHTATLLPSGLVLVTGGNGGNPALTELYDPIANAWAPGGTMAAARVGHTATLLPDGRVLVAAGSGTTSAELFDPIRRTWSVTGSLGEPHDGGSAVLLHDGTVLMVGGAPGNSQSLTRTLERYDPSSGAWSVVGALRYSHGTAMATPLPDGRILVINGTSLVSWPVPELIDPANGFRSESSGALAEARTDSAAVALADGRVLVLGGGRPFGTVGFDTDPADAFADLYTPGPSTTGVSPASGSSAGGQTVTINGTGFNLTTTAVSFGGTPAASFHVDSPTQITAVSPAEAAGAVDITVTTAGGASVAGPQDLFTVVAPLPPPPPPAPAGVGYWLVASDGGIFPFGHAGGFGSTGNIRLNQSIVGMAPTPDGRGYWLVAADGGIFPFGDARGFGSTGAIRLNKPIVGMAATPDGGGYWLVASDGGIFPFGDARGFGSTGAIRLNKPVVGMAPTPDGGGYWLVASDGGIFPFGDARGFGSTGAIRLNKPVVGMAPTPDSGGYWLVASDGGIFPFGDAQGFGSTGAIRLNKPMVGMATTHDGGGYWLVASDGGIFPFGNAVGLGSTGGIALNRPIVGMAATAAG